jgi:hypothetical protein
MILSHIVHVLRAWRLYRVCVHELSRLSDRELADIGLTRTGNASVAWHSAQDYIERAQAAARAGSSNSVGGRAQGGR